MKRKLFALVFVAVASISTLQAQLIPSWEHNGIYYENVRDTFVVGEVFPGHIVKVSTKYENDSPNGTMGSARMVFGIYTGNIVIPSDFIASGSHYFVEAIGSCAFQYCYDVTSVTLPNSIKWIEQNAFNGCSSLRFIEIPNSVDSIGQNAFKSCNSLESVTIGVRLKTIASNAFSNCRKIKEVFWNAYWCYSVSSQLFPNSLESITFGNDAFVPNNICAGKTNLTRVLMPETYLMNIGENAFYGCSKLSSIHFPALLERIGKNAFNGTSLYSITIPENVWFIGTNAFDGCHPLVVYWNTRRSEPAWQYIDFGNALSNVSFGEEVTVIPMGICRNKTKIQEINIPSSVKYIATDAFAGCTGLRKLTLGNGLKKIYNNAFNGCVNLATALALPDGLDTICNGAFNGCSQIPSITINNNLKLIDGNAFYGCTNLKTVYNFSPLVIVPNASTNGFVAKYANQVYNNMDRQGEYLFSGTSLIGYTGYATDITLPADNKGSMYSIGDQVFFGATLLSSITISDGVDGIGDSAFEGCTGLTNLVIPNNVTYIGANAVKGCSGITAVTLGPNLTQVGANAFANCTGIQEIICYAITPPAASANTFSNVPSNATLKIPAGSLNVYRNAQGWNHFTNIVETNLVNTTGVTLSATTINLKKGKEAVLYASVKPNNATYKTVTWSTSNNNIASVTNGVVYGKNAGTATITCTTTNGGYDATCTVTVTTNAILSTGFQFYKYAARNSEVYVPYSAMNEGDTLTFMELGTGFITVNVMPYSVTNGNIDFTVSDPSIISAELTEHINFANSIKISPLRPGVSKITFSTTDGSNISKSVYVKITPDPTIYVIGVRCVPRELTIGVGEKDTIEASVLPFNATTNTNVFWSKASGGNPLSVNIRALGLGSNLCEITAKSVGAIKVVVGTSGDEYTDTCTINVIRRVAVTGLSLNQANKTMKIGETLQLTPIITPSNATNQNVYWSMDNDTVVTLQEGLVEAINVGTVTITCTSEDGAFVSTCDILVEETPAELIVVRLEPTSASKWGEVYLYSWTGAGETQPTGAWPGILITKDGGGWYSHTFDNHIQNINIIWNNGAGAQTVDITGVTESTCYALNSTTGTSINVTVVSCDVQALDEIPDDLSNKTQKALIGGQLYILLPDGTKYSATGKKVE